MKYVPLLILTLGLACSSDHNDKPAPVVAEQLQKTSAEFLLLKQSTSVFPADGKMHLLSTIDAGNDDLFVSEAAVRHVGTCVLSVKAVSKSKVEIHASSAKVEACETSFQVQVPSRKIDQTFAVEATSQAVENPPETSKDDIHLTQTIKEFIADSQDHVLATIDAGGSDALVRHVNGMSSGPCLFSVVKTAKDKAEIRASSTAAGLCKTLVRVEVVDRNIDQTFPIEVTAKAPADLPIPIYKLNVTTRLKQFPGDSQEHLLTQVDLGGKAFSLTETETTGACTFRILATAANSYEVRIQSAKPGNCSALFHVQAQGSVWGEDFEVTAEATKQKDPIPGPTPSWKSFKVEFGDFTLSLESDGSSVRVVDYPRQFKSSYSVTRVSVGQDKKEDCSELASTLSLYSSYTPEWQEQLRIIVRESKAWTLKVYTLPFLQATFSRKVIDAAKNQGILLTSANILNLPKMTKVNSRLTFASDALSNYLGTKGLAEQVSDLNTVDFLQFGQQALSIQAQDLLCDLQSGKAKWNLEFTGEFQAEGKTVNYTPQSTVVKDQ